MTKLRKQKNQPLVLFHPTPYSSDYYKDFIQIIAADRHVIAIDTPGYGDSAPPPEPLSLPDYASALATALEALGYGDDGRKVDMLGFHTGALIAAELAATRPDLTRRIILPGLPYFTGDAQKKMYEENARPEPVKEDGSHLGKKWDFADLRHERRFVCGARAGAFLRLHAMLSQLLVGLSRCVHL